ncbi:MAG: DUF3987 domain-containing protein [Ruminococcaceae bacterium]|nr:DUF3987 domain-containing protein [Oscillospiraceae bacterium]
MTVLPDNMVKNGLFCCWRYEERNGRRTKVPYQPDTGRGARSNDPRSFVPYDIAVKSKNYDGIGIGIINGICAIDLDNCVTDSGFYSETAAEIVHLMHSYTEYSPSGNGLHIFFRADDFQYDTKRFNIMNHQLGIEVYVAGATNKYVTVTGNVCESYEFGDRSKELQVMLERYMVRPESESTNAINAAKTPTDIEAMLRLAKESRNGEAFSALWKGSTTDYESHSEADMALCNHLAFWTGKDADKMDELFRQSGLMRDKWDRPQSGTTYGALTIRKAIDNCKDVYTPKEEQRSEFLPLIPLTPHWNDLPPFPVDALPEVIRRYVDAVVEHSQTAPDMVAVISLGVLAICLQGKLQIEGTPDYCEPLSLYTVVIAAPGERKSSVMRDMTKYLYEYEQEYNKARSSEVRENRLQRESLERQISGLQKKLERAENSDVKTELRQLQEELENLPEIKPVRFFADDCSSEALTSLMAANGGIFSVISTEGGIFDIMAGRYSNKANIDIWLKGHCGDSIYVDRMTRDSECILHPALSAILSIQPSVLDEIMSNTTMTGRGLIARFLYSSPPSRIGCRTFRTPAVPTEISEEYRKLIFRLMAMPCNDEIQTLSLSEKAFELMANYFQEHEKFLAGEGQAISDWASKYIGAVLRIAGLLHGAEMEEGDFEVSASTMHRAIRIGKYFLAHSAYAYSVMGTDLSIQKAKFVMAKLKKTRVYEIKRSELFQMCRGKFFKKTEEIIPTLELLEGHGYLRMEEPERQTIGRPPDVRIFINPDAA